MWIRVSGLSAIEESRLQGTTHILYSGAESNYRIAELVDAQYRPQNSSIRSFHVEQHDLRHPISRDA